MSLTVIDNNGKVDLRVLRADFRFFLGFMGASWDLNANLANFGRRTIPDVGFADPLALLEAAQALNSVERATRSAKQFLL